MKSDEFSFEGIDIFSNGVLENLSITFTLNGYLDSINSTKVTEYFNLVIIPNKGIKIVLLDLLKLTYASSTGIGVFAALLMSCKKQNIELEMMNVGSKILDVISLLGFTAFFKIRD